MCSPPPPEQGRNGSTTTLRRHKTLPGPLRSFPTINRGGGRHRCNVTSSMRLSKSNPYVGWFRHAPPSLFQHLTAEATEWLQKTKTSTHSYYLLRRASTFTSSHKPSQLLACCRGEEYNVAVYRALKFHLHHHHEDFTAGMLLGGTTVDDLEAAAKHNKLSTSTIVNSNVLSKMACWFLDVSLLENPPSLQEIDAAASAAVDEKNTNSKKCSSGSSVSSGKSVTSASLMSQEEEDDDDLTIESRDEQGRANATRRPQAAADDDDRLDYNITQMDIVRMNRIASRHLDVESIFNLPTITYQPPVTRDSLQNTNNNNNCNNNGKNKDDDNCFSWMLVHSDSEASEADGGHHDATAHLYEGCVICLEGFNAGDRLRILPCKHKFHISCIDKWLSGANSDQWCVTSGCPTCKAPPMTTLESSVVPGWAFARIGDALIRESQHL